VITANVNTDYDIMSIEIDGYIDEEAYRIIKGAIKLYDNKPI
jgi:hypothetical protein